jgi:predicted transcriptional regulator
MRRIPSQKTMRSAFCSKTIEEIRRCAATADGQSVRLRESQDFTLTLARSLITIKPTLKNQQSPEEAAMARPAAKDLTDRELEIMHQFWSLGEATVADVRDGLAKLGVELAQTTVGTLVRILHEKGFLEQTQMERPARYQPTRSFEDVSRTMVGDMLSRVFLGQPEQLLACLFGGDRLSKKDRERLLKILKEEQP